MKIYDQITNKKKCLFVCFFVFDLLMKIKPHANIIKQFQRTYIKINERNDLMNVFNEFNWSIKSINEL